jgi:hypothetical protein
MSTQGHGMIEEPDTVEARYLPKCLSGDNHQGNCHNYVFDYVHLTEITLFLQTRLS